MTHTFNSSTLSQLFIFSHNHSLTLIHSFSHNHSFTFTNFTIVSFVNVWYSISIFFLCSIPLILSTILPWHCAWHSLGVTSDTALVSMSGYPPFLLLKIFYFYSFLVLLTSFYDLLHITIVYPPNHFLAAFLDEVLFPMTSSWANNSVGFFHTSEKRWYSSLYTTFIRSYVVFSLQSSVVIPRSRKSRTWFGYTSAKQWYIRYTCHSHFTHKSMVTNTAS